MLDLTVITPIGPTHEALFAFCAASVQGQTIPVQHLYSVDSDRLGPGVIRNRLLKQVQTRYVTFLDADDWLEPAFAERTLAACVPGRYVYTDWYQDAQRIKSPDRPWCNGTFHLVTAVIPTEIALAVGGFDESLPGMEDTDFYLKLLWRGMCGRRVPVPLLHYRRDGGRANSIHATGVVERLRDEINRRYGGRPLSCCGAPAGPSDPTPIGERAEGDVRAQALWGGNRTEIGRATGRRYPRTSWPHVVWVNPLDVQAAPQLWQIVPERDPDVLPEDSEPEQLRGVMALEAQLMQVNLLRKAQTPTSVVPVAPIPNTRKVKRLAGAVEGLPVFVKSRKPYPSYSDFWRLVDLSGFGWKYQDEIDLSDARQTYIFVTPDGIPDCSAARARTIFWQFEYAGDYTRQANRETVSEQWTSDPADSARTGAELVILGSHPGLNPDLKRAIAPQYDLTMLAYMVDRRLAIKRRLSQYEWTPDYPGHDGYDRHQMLKATRLMLHVHQHEQPALAPIRYALAAAYHLPVLAERADDGGLYGTSIIWGEYDQIPELAELQLNGKLGDDNGQRLHQLLCVDRRFDREVLRALGQEVRAVA